ncbi:MAG TPA: hypothetical protein VKH34_09590 [Vicinamibacterales bacterium]|nr:hypothetical protein [Vicinamibacterales bacterium]
MTKKLSRLIGMAAALLVASCTLGWAQQPGADPAFERMRTKLKPGNRVTIDLQNGSTLAGRFVDAGPGTMTIATVIGDRTLTPAEMLRVQRHRHGVLLGAIIGGGAGLFFGIGTSMILRYEGYDGDGALFGLTALGLGVGIGLDALINIPRTVYSRPAFRATVGLATNPRRPGVQLVFTF